MINYTLLTNTYSPNKPPYQCPTCPRVIQRRGCRLIGLSRGLGSHRIQRNEDLREMVLINYPCVCLMNGEWRCKPVTPKFVTKLQSRGLSSEAHSSYYSGTICLVIGFQAAWNHDKRLINSLFEATLCLINCIQILSAKACSCNSLLEMHGLWRNIDSDV
ncbi:hypothetical protein CDAR_431031 [Caerostris darwini]|uniref:Uncharacterized protein n=1 Tax=Caerostris darwini TaxID=1538125 RepID=A0AAV4UJ17_9ARAC|nr:hypothetical protein CDAR_431031 [Caerostris darwini]